MSGLGSFEFKRMVSEFYSGVELEKAALTETIEAVDHWRLAVEANKYVDEFEEIVREWAKKEWGDGTRVEFDKQTMAAAVISADGFLRVI